MLAGDNGIEFRFAAVGSVLSQPANLAREICLTNSRGSLELSSWDVWVGRPWALRRRRGVSSPGRDESQTVWAMSNDL